MRALCLMLMFSLLGCYGDCPDYGKPSILLNLYDEETGEEICDGIVTLSSAEDQYLEFITSEDDCTKAGIIIELDQSGEYSIDVNSEGYDEWGTESEEVFRPNKCGGIKWLDIPLKKSL